MSKKGFWLLLYCAAHFRDFYSPLFITDRSREAKKEAKKVTTGLEQEGWKRKKGTCYSSSSLLLAIQYYP